MMESNYVHKIGKHPILEFLKKELKMNLSDFSAISGIPQSTVSTWIQRERELNSLPIYFYVALADLSNLRLDEVYNKLIRLESEYKVNQVKTKTFLAKEQLLLVDKVKKEARIVRSELKQLKEELNLLSSVRQLKKAVGKKRPDEFMTVLIALYASIWRTVPEWVTGIFVDQDSFVEIALSYIEVFSEIE